MRGPLLLSILLSSVASCSDDARPSAPVANGFESGKGGSGQSGAGGGAGQAAGGAAGAAGASGAGGASGAAGAGGGAGGPGMGCSAFQPEKVYLFGTLAEGADQRDAFAAPEAPGKYCVAFPNTGTFAPTLRRSDGALIYQDPDTKEIRQYVADSLEWNDEIGWWGYPMTPESNDILIATVQCGGGIATELHTIPEDGAVVYRCGFVYVTADGSLIGKSGMLLLAIGPSRQLLSNGTEDHPSDIVLIDAQGTETIVVGGVPAERTRVGRATEGGYWVAAFGETSADPIERWFVTPEGVASHQGTWCNDLVLDGTIGAGTADESARIDAEGNLWQEGARSTASGGGDVIIKRPMAPGVCEIVYDEKDLPPNDWQQPTGPKLSVRWHLSHLVTGR